MTIGHIGGAPVEELLLPLIGSGSAFLLLAAQVAVGRLRRLRSRQR